jgi:uncharacterized membrane protein YozB (DUF420 family)
MIELAMALSATCMILCAIAVMILWPKSIYSEKWQIDAANQAAAGFIVFTYLFLLFGAIKCLVALFS